MIVPGKRNFLKRNCFYIGLIFFFPAPFIALATNLSFAIFFIAIANFFVGLSGQLKTIPKWAKIGTFPNSDEGIMICCYTASIIMFSVAVFDTLVVIGIIPFQPVMPI